MNQPAALEGTVRPLSLPAIELLLSALDERGVRYCHWKSNHRLDQALTGADDLDLLVDRRHAVLFQEVLAAAGFKRVVASRQAGHPSVEQYYAVDPGSMRLFHIDAYYRVITGETLVKDFHLPLERMLLEERRTGDALLPVPSAAADLATLVVRLMIKLSSTTGLLPGERAKLLRVAREEIAALRPAADLAEVSRLLARHLPAVDPQLWRRSLDAVTAGPVSTARLLSLAFSMRRQLRPYRRFGFLRGTAIRVAALTRLLGSRLLLVARRRLSRNSRGPEASSGVESGGARGKRFATGGAVIAFVGPEATGKSTLASTLANWVGEAVSVHRVHLGKPPSTLLTALPNLLLPIFRRRAPEQRSDLFRDETGKPTRLLAARCVMLAWDRYRLALRAHRLAGNGALVFTDRYPSGQVGTVDSARLPPGEWGGFVRWATATEARLYRLIPQPDLVVELTVPPEIAVMRNRARDKPGKESDERVLARHAHGLIPRFDAHTLYVDTTGTLEDTLRTVKGAVWSEL